MNSEMCEEPAAAPKKPKAKPRAHPAASSASMDSTTPRDPARKTVKLPAGVLMGNMFPCPNPGCDRSFPTHPGMKLHVAAKHKVVKQEPVEEERIPEELEVLERGMATVKKEQPDMDHTIPKLFPCTIPGCTGGPYNLLYNLRHHLKSKHGMSNAEAREHAPAHRDSEAAPGPAPKAVDPEDDAAPELVPEEAEEVQVVAPPVGDPLVFPCTYPGCDRTFDNQKSMKIHFSRHAKVLVQLKEPELKRIPEEQDQEPEVLERGMFPCAHPGCGRSFPTKKGLKRHFGAIHKVVKQEPVDEEQQIPEEQNPEPEVLATVEEEQQELDQTIPEPHGDRKLFACTLPGCSAGPYSKLYNLRRHLRKSHGMSDAEAQKHASTARRDSEVVEEEHPEAAPELAPEAMDPEDDAAPQLAPEDAEEVQVVAPSVQDPLAFPCTDPGCDRSFAKQQGMKVHFNRNHKVIKHEPVEEEEQLPEEQNPEPKVLERGMFPCTHPGCDRLFPTEKGMKRHFAAKHKVIKQEPVEEEPEAAPELAPEEAMDPEVNTAPRFASEDEEDVQVITQFPCPFPQCIRTFDNQKSMRIHLSYHARALAELNVPDVPEEQDPEVLEQRGMRIVEEEPVEQAPEEQIPEVEDPNLSASGVPKLFACTYPGCGGSFPTEAGMKRHFHFKHKGKKQGMPDQKNAPARRDSEVAPGLAPEAVDPEDVTASEVPPEEEVQDVAPSVGDPLVFSCTHPGCDRSFAKQQGMKLHFNAKHKVIKQEPVEEEEQLPEEQNPEPEVLERGMATQIPSTQPGLEEPEAPEVDDPNLSVSSQPGAFKLFACMLSGCPRSYKVKTSMQRHMRQSHGSEFENQEEQKMPKLVAAEPPKSTEIRVFQCQLCRQEPYVKEHFFKKHMLNVHGIQDSQIQFLNQDLPQNPEIQVPKQILMAEEEEAPEVQNNVVLDPAVELLEFDLGIDDEVTLDEDGIAMPRLEKFENFQSGKARKVFVCTYDRCGYAPFKSSTALGKHISQIHKRGQLEGIRLCSEYLMKTEQREEVPDEQPGCSKLKCPYTGCLDSFDSQRGFDDHLHEHRQVAARQISEGAEPVEILDSKSSSKSVVTSSSRTSAPESSSQDSTISSSDEYPDDMAPYPIPNGLYGSEFDDFTTRNPELLELNLMWSEECGEKQDPMMPKEEPRPVETGDVQETLKAYKCTIPGCRNNRFANEQNLAKHYHQKHGIPYEMSNNQPIRCEFPGCMHKPFKNHNGLTRHVNRMHKQRMVEMDQKKGLQMHPQKVVHIKEQPPTASSTETVQSYTVEFPEEDYQRGLSSSSVKHEDSDEYDYALNHRHPTQNSIYQRHIQQQQQHQQMMMSGAQDDGEEQDLNLYGSGPLECHRDAASNSNVYRSPIRKRPYYMSSQEAILPSEIPAPPAKRQRVDDSFGDDRKEEEEERKDKKNKSEWSDGSEGEEEFEEEDGEEEEHQDNRPTIGDSARLLIQQLCVKQTLTEKKPYFCLPCLDYKLGDNQCTRQHTDIEEQLQSVWIQNYADQVTHPLSKQAVLKILNEIADKWQ